MTKTMSSGGMGGESFRYVCTYAKEVEAECFEEWKRVDTLALILDKARREGAFEVCRNCGQQQVEDEAISIPQ